MDDLLMTTNTDEHTLLERLRGRFQFLPKDFVETSDGLVAAVVGHGLEDSRVLVYPRYVRSNKREAVKLDSLQAFTDYRDLIAAYQSYSPRFDVSLTRIPQSSIAKHFCPENRIRALCPHPATGDKLSSTPPQSLVELSEILERHQQHLGITGSHLISTNRDSSDIDLVVYGLTHFLDVRQTMVEAVEVGRMLRLTERDWELAYDKRGAIDLNAADYRWHELRKLNKFLMMDGTRLDLTCVDVPHPVVLRSSRKIGRTQVVATVNEDTHAFNTPGVLGISHSEFKTIIVNTATYIGQVEVGESIEVVGTAEIDDFGDKRIVVGASREASGELLRVIR